MKLILSTSNIVQGGSTNRPFTSSKSNLELTSTLRSNFQHYALEANGVAKNTAFPAWTRRTESLVEIPALDNTETALEEEREQYDITIKLFFLPGSALEDREQYIREAVRLVLDALHMPSIDLLIACFPDVYFDEEEESPTKLLTREPVDADPEPLADQVRTWMIFENLHSEGVVKRLGVAEFGHDRLQSFLGETTTKPSVDQINLRDCCSVPRDLMKLAKTEGVELLVHNDCSNILPRGTLRELLGPDGAGILPATPSTGDKRSLSTAEGSTAPVITGEIHPQWVVKYTAVVRNRGVVESKGYFAMAVVKD